MKELNYKIGTIVRLEGCNHVGIVLDKYNTIELIGYAKDQKSEPICRIVAVNIQRDKKHPVTGKEFTYKVEKLKKGFTSFEFTTSELKKRIKQIRSKYEGTKYNKITNNCQHFAYEVATGERKSPDADPFKMFSMFEKQLSAIEKMSNGDSTSSTNSVDLQSFRNNFDELIFST